MIRSFLSEFPYLGGASRIFPTGGSVFGFRLAPAPVVDLPDSDTGDGNSMIDRPELYPTYPVGVHLRTPDGAGDVVLIRGPNWSKIDGGANSLSFATLAEMEALGFAAPTGVERGAIQAAYTKLPVRCVLDIADAEGDFMADNQRTYTQRHRRKLHVTSPPTSQGWDAHRGPPDLVGNDGNTFVRIDVIANTLVSFSNLLVKVGSIDHNLLSMGFGIAPDGRYFRTYGGSVMTPNVGQNVGLYNLMTMGVNPGTEFQFCIDYRFRYG